MIPFKFGDLIIEGSFDKDDELEVEIEKEESHYVWLPRGAVIRLRDHLNDVLGVAT